MTKTKKKRAKKLGLIQNKGGAGKTTTVANLAGALSVSYPDKKILLAGVDGQGNITSSFGVKPNDLENTMYDVFLGNCDVEDIIVKNVAGTNIDIAPANRDMNFLEFDLMQTQNDSYYNLIQSYRDTPSELFKLNKEQMIDMLKVQDNPSGDYFNMLDKKFDKVEEEYDYILFDTPPEIKSVTSSVISIVDNIIIPFDPDPQSLEGIVNIMPRIMALKNEYNPDLNIAGILATKIRANIRVHAQLTKKVMMYCMNNHINYFNVEIPQSSKFAAVSANSGLPGTLVEADDKFISSYFALLKELEEKGVL